MYEDIFLDVTAALEALGKRHGEGDFQAKWEDRHWMNTPGPIYGGDTVSCGTGPLEAPNNVGVDERWHEIIYRQPVNGYELRQVVQAAWAEVADGYGADGDLHWSYTTVREWWADPRRKLEQELQRLYDTQLALLNGKSDEYISMLARWMDYLTEGMHQYLQVYAFFLDNGRIPMESDRLPEL
jgi:hypothetical protein